MGKSKVSIVKTDPQPDFPAIRQAVEKAINLIGGIEDLIKPGKKVLLNPSWVAPPTEPEKGCITQAEVTRAVADIVQEMGARAIIAESAAVGVDSEKVIEASGYGQLRESGYEVIDLKKTAKIMIPVPGWKVFKEIESHPLVREADVIVSLPKMKTHDQTEITCAIKKLKGLLSDQYKRMMHQEGLFEGVVDLLAAVQPQLTIVDAIYCQEGLGPVFGKPVEMDLILAGKDLVAVDAVCGRIMDFAPEEIQLTKIAAARGLGTHKTEEIAIVGEPLEKVRRRFLRSIEDSPVQVEGFNLIHGGITCTGCRNTVMSALVDMRNADQLMYLPGVTVVTGDPAIPPFVPTESIVTVGKCVPEGKRGQRYVRGCPPNNVYVVQAIIGEKGKAKRMYAEGDLDSTKQK
ncbi:MAG: DUF362 domain-containing protein [Proteobacteria bacterium]|nr:DUF362 domain-containing protein [Pseudomonadota bacterium]